jgi:hypothetical protein
MLQFLPSIPPLSCDATIPDRWSSWLCENRYWAVSHSSFPFLVYLYLLDWKWVLLLMYLFETLEAAISVIGGGGPLSGQAESLGDSLIGDIVMGSMGIIVGVLSTKVLKWRYAKIPDAILGYESLWLKYLFQLGVFSVPTAFIFLFDLYGIPQYFSDGTMSIIFLGWVVWTPSFFALFAWWNSEDYQWTAGGLNSEKPPRGRYKRTHMWLTFGLFFYLAAFIYRWAPVWVMAIIYGTVIITSLAVILLER